MPGDSEIETSGQTRGRLERTRHRRADGDDTPLFLPGMGDLLRRCGGDLDLFRVQAVVFGLFDRHRLEGAGADREGQVGDPDAASADPLQDLGRKVQAGCRRGDGPSLPGKDGLVGHAVLGAVGGPGLSPDVGRKRNAADLLEEGVVDVPVEANLPAAVFTDRFDDGSQSAGEPDLVLRLRPAPRPRQGGPATRIAADRLQQEDLDQPAGGVEAPEARVADADVVAHHQVSSTEQLRELGEPPVLDGAGPPVEKEQAARSPRPRRLRDPIRRKKVVEQLDLQDAENDIRGNLPRCPPTTSRAAAVSAWTPRESRSRESRSPAGSRSTRSPPSMSSWSSAALLKTPFPTRRSASRTATSTTPPASPTTPRAGGSTECPPHASSHPRKRSRTWKGGWPSPRGSRTWTTGCT